MDFIGLYMMTRWWQSGDDLPWLLSKWSAFRFLTRWSLAFFSGVCREGSKNQPSVRRSNMERRCRYAADTNLELLVAERAHAAQTLIG